MKPGASMSDPATRMSSPSTSSLPGTRPWSTAREIRSSVARPWRLSSQAPTHALDHQQGDGLPPADDLRHLDDHVQLHQRRHDEQQHDPDHGPRLPATRSVPSGVVAAVTTGAGPAGQDRNRRDPTALRWAGDRAGGSRRCGSHETSTPPPSGRGTCSSTCAAGRHGDHRCAAPRSTSDRRPGRVMTRTASSPDRRVGCARWWGPGSPFGSPVRRGTIVGLAGGRRGGHGPPCGVARARALPRGVPGAHLGRSLCHRLRPRPASHRAGARVVTRSSWATPSARARPAGRATERPATCGVTPSGRR